MTHYFLSVQNSYEQNFPQESSEAFLNLKKYALHRTKKKIHQRVLTERFEKHFEKKT